MNEKRKLKMDKQEFIDGAVGLIVAFVCDLLRYVIAWFAYLVLRFVFPQLPDLGFIKFILAFAAISVMVSMLFDKSDDEKEQ